jgi:IMP dehydrogenase
VPLIADGGVRRDGALVQALLFGGDTVMLGSALAGTTETPGDIVQKPSSSRVAQDRPRAVQGVPRMASLEAIVDRLDVEDLEAADVEALGAEGMEVAVPARGSVRPVLRDMLKHSDLGDQLRRRDSLRVAGDVPQGSAALRHPADGIGPRESFDR